MTNATLWSIIVLLSIGIVILSVVYFRKYQSIKPMQSRLLRAEQSLDLAEKIGGVGTWYIDRTNNALYWSEQVFAIHGRPLSKGTPLLAAAVAYYHPADRNRLVELVNTALRRGEGYECKARILTDQGEVKDVISRAVCQLDTQGEVKFVFGVIIATAPEMPVIPDLSSETNGESGLWPMVS